MVKITTSLIKKLRDMTGAGIIDCRRALINADGDIELSIEDLRKSGVIKALKKSANIVTEGIIKTKINSNYGIILEINCQTDFTIRNNIFQIFSNKIANTVLDKKITDINLLRAYFEKERINLVAKIGENINIRRVSILEGELVCDYLHHSARIGVLVAAKGINNRVIKQIAMHIAAKKPEFINSRDIPNEVIEKEYQTQLNIATQFEKKKEIIKEIVNGRMRKFSDEISLVNQVFVIDTSKTVGQFLRENDVKVTNFIRFEVGEKY